MHPLCVSDCQEGSEGSDLVFKVLHRREVAMKPQLLQVLLSCACKPISTVLSCDMCHACHKYRNK